MESNPKETKDTSKIDKEIVKMAVENGAAVVTILHGKAPEQLKIHNNKPVDISGTIDAPSRFCAIRDFEQKKSHALVNVSKGEIELVVNEQSTDDKFTVKGKVVIGRIFADLGINSGKFYASPQDLAKKLRLMRNIFKSSAEHADLIANLRNVKAKVNAEVEQSKDNSGNALEYFKQTVESNMPKGVALRLPLIEGQNPVEIELEVILEVEGRDIICSLESVDAAEEIDKFIEKIINEEVEKIKDKTTVFFV